MVILLFEEFNSVEYDFNSYTYQIIINIERNFGLLVNRWVILQKPCDVPIGKNLALTMDLFKLHYFLIDENDSYSFKPSIKDITLKINYHSTAGYIISVQSWMMKWYSLTILVCLGHLLVGSSFTLYWSWTPSCLWVQSETPNRLCNGSIEKLIYLYLD